MMVDLVTVSILAVIVLVAVIGLSLVVGRMTTPSRPMPMPIAGGAPSAYEAITAGMIELQSQINAIHETILRHPAGAMPLGTLPPKPHRPQFQFTSEERTNKVHRIILTCRVEGCPDTLIVDAPEPALMELLAREGRHGGSA